MIRTAVVLGLCCGATAVAAAGEPLGATEFLATVKGDYRLRNHQELIDYLRRASTTTPYLDRVELRTETDDFDIQKQRYSLRLYPKGWGETTANRRLESAVRLETALDHQLIFDRALKQRYDLILQHREVTALIALTEQLLSVYADRIAVMRTLATTRVDFDVTLLIAAENGYVDLELDLVRFRDQLTSAVHRIEVLAGGRRTVAFAGTPLLPVARVAALVRQIRPGIPAENISLRDRAHKVELAEIKYGLEVARNRDYLQFLSLDFDTQRADQLRRAFSLGLAVKLPLTNSDQYDINRRKTDHIAEKLRYEEERRAVAERLVSLSRSLGRFVEQHQILSRRKAGDDARTSFRRYLQMEGADPLVLLKIKESILRGDRRLAEMESSIYRCYLDLLEATGKLAEPPLRNRLSAKLEPIR